MTTATAIQQALTEHATSERRQALRAVIQLVRDVLDGRHSDAAVISRTIDAAAMSPEQYISAVHRAEMRRELVRLTALQSEIQSAVSPIGQQIDAAIAAHEAACRAHEQHLDDLRSQIRELREPLSGLPRLQDDLSRADRESEIPSVVSDYGALQHTQRQRLLTEQRRNQHGRSRPDDPETTPSDVQRWRLEEDARLETLARVRRTLDVMSSTWQLIQERFFDAETGIWQHVELSDIAECEQIAADRWEAAQRPAAAATVDPDEPPAVISTLGARARALAE